jgi:hypothetical protein
MFHCVRCTRTVDFIIIIIIIAIIIIIIIIIIMISVRFYLTIFSSRLGVSYSSAAFCHIFCFSKFSELFLYFITHIPEYYFIVRYGNII